MTNKVSTDELLKRVEERKKFLELIIDCIPKLVLEHGERVSYVEKPYHIEAEHVLKGLDGFSFYTQGSFTMYGGENLKVWHHPGSTKSEGVAPVLNIDWWKGVEDCKVHAFNPGSEWQKRLKAIAADKDTALRKAAQAAAEQASNDKRVAQEAARVAAEQHARRLLEANLPKEAERLRVA